MQLSYQQYIIEGINRWLHTIDVDPTSKTYGFCDRDYWAWKIKDFNNGTPQGGLAAFLDGKAFFPDIDSQQIVNAVIKGTQTLQRSNGSFEEAYPLEGSCCVTALVLFNLLYAYFLNIEDFNAGAKKRLTNIVEKGYQFLRRVDEGHGQIANHQATIVLAQWLCEKFLDKPKSFHLLEAFLSLQDSEGWFTEYNGADPGYQTLLNHYIHAYAQIETLELPLRHALEQSEQFCARFCFEDGSYAGELGARGTHIVYPSGLAQSEWFIENYLNNPEAVTPLNVDINNLVPVLCSWTLFNRDMKQATQGSQPVYTSLPNAGYEIFRQNQSELIISKKTGAIKKSGSEVYSHWAYQNLTTQHALVSYDHTDMEIILVYGSRERRQMLNDGFKMAILRTIAFMIYPFPSLQKLFKRLLAKQVMGEVKVNHEPAIEVMINLQEGFTISWRPVSASGKHFKLYSHGFQTHMASANTFQRYGT